MGEEGEVGVGEEGEGGVGEKERERSCTPLFLPIADNLASNFFMTLI